MKIIQTSSLCVIIGLLGFCSCNSNPGTITEELPANRVSLPDLPSDDRAVSAEKQIYGANFVSIGPGTTEWYPVLNIDASVEGLSWAMYGFAVPNPAQLNSLLIKQSELTGGYWVGLSDYGVSNSWDWLGPFSDDAQIEFNSDFDRYLSPAGTLYWLVVAEGNSTVLLEYSEVDYTSELQFRIPPSGLQNAAPAPATNPSLVLMPEINGLSEAGAPVIFYNDEEGYQSRVRYAFYNGTSWDSRLFNSDFLLHIPAALWANDSGIVIARDRTAGPPGPDGNGRLVVHYCNPDWSVVNREELTTAPSGPALNFLNVDYDPISGDVALIHAYTQMNFGDLVRLTVGNSTDGWLTSAPTIPEDHIVTGADIAFNPTTNLPMAVYSSGTIDTTETVILDTTLQYGSFNGTGWDFSTADYNAPLTLDLGFAPDDTPRLLMVSARDFSYRFPPPPLPPLIDLTATLYFDIVSGEFTTDWAFETLYESQVDISEIFSNRIGLDLGVDAAWASPDELVFSHAEGVIEFEINPEFAITGGNMTNNVTYLEGDGGGGFGSSTYFDGDPGVSFSWQEGPDGPVCAYIRGDGLDVTGLLGGGVDTSNELYYWSPPPAP